MIYKDMDKWMAYQGIKFLKDIGMKSNQVVLDFGCKHGTYTIPAAIVVGENGKVYAIDKNKDALNKLSNKAVKKELKNIELISLTDQINIFISNDFVDMILLFDVLHLVKNREQLLTDLYRILKPLGILSVYPKHHKEDMHMNLNEVKEEIEEIGFCFEKKSLKTLMHDDSLERGYVLNFKKM